MSFFSVEEFIFQNIKCGLITDFSIYTFIWDRHCSDSKLPCGCHLGIMVGNDSTEYGNDRCFIKLHFSHNSIIEKGKSAFTIDLLLFVKICFQFNTAAVPVKDIIFIDFDCLVHNRFNGKIVIIPMSRRNYEFQRSGHI